MVLTSFQARMYDISILSAASAMLPVVAMCLSNSTLPGPSAISLPRSTLKRGRKMNPAGFFSTRSLWEMLRSLERPHYAFGIRRSWPARGEITLAVRLVAVMCNVCVF